MRIIAKKTLKDFWKKHPDSKGQLLAWYDETKNAVWHNHNELKTHITDASVIGAKRVAFNIKDNHYRLIVDIEYSIQLVFIVWLGTHSDYNKINTKTISYAKSNKNKKTARTGIK